MAILSIGAPSGFEVLEEGVAATPFVKRTEVSGGRLNIYFDEVGGYITFIYLLVKCFSNLFGFCLSRGNVWYMLLSYTPFIKNKINYIVLFNLILYVPSTIFQ